MANQQNSSEEISDVFYLDTFQKMSKQERISMPKSLYVHLKTVYNAELSKAITCQDMFDGSQLSAETIGALESAEREPFTCNAIKQACLAHLGNLEAEFQRPEVRYIKPTQEDKTKERNIKNINSILSYYYDKLDIKGEILDAYLNSIVQGRAQIQVIYKNGELCLEVGSAISCLIDPNTTKRDMSDCSYVLEIRNFSKDLLISQYPEKATQINMAGLYLDERNIQQTIQPRPEGMCTVMTLHSKTYDYLSSNGKFGDTIILNILVTTGELLSLEQPMHTEFPWVLVSPKINKTFTTSGRKFLGLVEDVVSYQRMINKGMLTITNKIHTSMMDVVMYVSEAMENPDAFDEMLNCNVALKNVDDVSKVVSRLQTSDLPAIAIQHLTRCEDNIYFRLGATPPSMQEKSNEVVTASLMEVKNRNATKVNGYAKHQLEISHKSLVIKIIKIALQVCMSETRIRLEQMDAMGITTASKGITLEKLSDICGNEIKPEDLIAMHEALDDCMIIFMNAIDSTGSRERTLQGLQLLQELGIPVDPTAIIDALQLPNADIIKKYAVDRINQKEQIEMANTQLQLTQNTANVASMTKQMTQAQQQQQQQQMLSNDMQEEQMKQQME